MVLITYNSDLGDAWEWMDDPEYPAPFTGYAYRLGELHHLRNDPLIRSECTIGGDADSPSNPPNRLKSLPRDRIAFPLS